MQEREPTKEQLVFLIDAQPSMLEKTNTALEVGGGQHSCRSQSELLRQEPRSAHSPCSLAPC
jgi:hypothetical protein